MVTGTTNAPAAAEVAPAGYPGSVESAQPSKAVTLQRDEEKGCLEACVAALCCELHFSFSQFGDCK